MNTRRLSHDELADLGAAACEAFLEGPEAMAVFVRSRLFDAVGRGGAKTVRRDVLHPTSKAPRNRSIDAN